MAQRLALFLGSVAAAVALAVALAAAGFGPAAPSASPPISYNEQPADIQAGPVPSAEPVTEVDTVYVQPAPTPKTVRVVRTAAPRQPAATQVVTRPASGEKEPGDEGGDHEQGDD